MGFHICTKDDMHPYECYGEPPCIHCNRVKTEHHDPATCALCRSTDPECARCGEPTSSDEELCERCGKEVGPE